MSELLVVIIVIFINFANQDHLSGCNVYNLMATRTPSNEGGSSSGISDVKYQKAIKEISKLIALNTTLKNDNNKLQ